MAQGVRSLGHRRDSLDSLYTIALQLFKKRMLVAGGLNYAMQLDSANLQKHQGYFPIDRLPVPEKNIQYPDLLNRAIGKVDQMLNQVDNYMIEEIQIHLPLRRTKVEWFRKFTVAFACFIFFFVGAPLGAIIRKGGLGTPVIVSMLFFVVYYVIDISGKKLATDGSVSAAFGTLISSLVLLPIGVFLTYKATTDSALFNKDAYLAAIKKIWKHLPRYHGKEKRKA